MVSMIYIFWLVSWVVGIGVGWVFIFDLEQVVNMFEVDVNWWFVVYLCVGYLEEEYLDLELEWVCWQV